MCKHASAQMPQMNWGGRQSLRVLALLWEHTSSTFWAKMNLQFVADAFLKSGKRPFFPIQVVFPIQRTAFYNLVGVVVGVLGRIDQHIKIRKSCGVMQRTLAWRSAHQVSNIFYSLGHSALPIKGRHWTLSFLRSFLALTFYHSMQSTLYRMLWIPVRLDQRMEVTPSLGHEALSRNAGYIGNISKLVCF